MPTHTYRQRIRDAIVSALQLRHDVAGCWEGGSAATGRLDEFSDIDLVVVAPLDAAAAVFPVIETALTDVGEISHRWHVDPAPFATRRSVFIPRRRAAFFRGRLRNRVRKWGCAIYGARTAWRPASAVRSQCEDRGATA
ncbi:MAG: nucleotidyltransferase domain-containing protein [Burkholderiaceae bacterium]|nr:nucleotidyltransferase domain-containing protein [Burkholderiaceae bacterium]